MAYNENMGVNSPTNSVNSDGIMFYGPESCMRINFYNVYMSVVIYPIKPEADRTQKSVYNYDKKTSILLDREQIFYLSGLIDNKLIPATLKDEPCVIGTTVQKVNIFLISNGITKNKETGEIVKDAPGVAIFRGLNEYCIPSESMIFKFRLPKLVSSYDPESGSNNVSDDLSIGPFALQRVFHDCSALCGAANHANRYFNRFKNAQRDNFFEGVAAKLGVAFRDNPVNYVNEPSWNKAPNENRGNSEMNAVMSSASNFSDIEGVF